MAIDGKVDTDELKGREISVEVHLRSGAGSSHYGSDSNASTRTLLYKGIYEKTTFVGTQEMLVLTGGRHDSLSSLNRERISSERTYISLNDIISIDVMKVVDNTK